VRVGFDRVANQDIEIFQRFKVGVVAGLDRGTRIAIKRCATGFGDTFKRNILSEIVAVAILKCSHGAVLWFVE